MSSHIRVKKTCEFCNKEFVAKTIKTRYCSHSCNSKAYKEEQRNAKIKAAIIPTIPANPPKLKTAKTDYSVLSQKELLTVNEACQLLNITSVTLRRWIKDGIIKTHRLGKKHIIKRLEIDKML